MCRQQRAPQRAPRSHPVPARYRCYRWPSAPAAAPLLGLRLVTQFGSGPVRLPAGAAPAAAAARRARPGAGPSWRRPAESATLIQCSGRSSVSGTNCREITTQAGQGGVARHGVLHDATPFAHRGPPIPPSVSGSLTRTRPFPTRSVLRIAGWSGAGHSGVPFAVPPRGPGLGWGTGAPPRGGAVSPPRGPGWACARLPRRRRTSRGPPPLPTP